MTSDRKVIKLWDITEKEYTFNKYFDKITTNFQEKFIVKDKWKSLKRKYPKEYTREELGCRFTELNSYNIAKSDNLKLLKYAKEKSIPFDEWTCAYAAESPKDKEYKMLKWLRLSGCPWNRWTLINIARNGDFDILKWALQENCPITDDPEIKRSDKHDLPLASFAAQSGNFKMFMYLVNNNFYWKDTLTARFAVESGNLEMIRYVLQNNCPYNNNLTSVAAENKHFDIVKILYSQGHPLDNNVFYSAIQYGDHEMVKWLYERKCGGEESCNIAAKYGHLDILKWLRSEKFYWNYLTCKEAADNNHLEILKWLIENGCPCQNEYKFLVY